MRFGAIFVGAPVSITACGTSPEANFSPEPYTPSAEIGPYLEQRQGEAPNCTPGYDPCLPDIGEYDCYPGPGDGPLFTGQVAVTRGMDRYKRDMDGNGRGCEMSPYVRPVQP
jgi:hypothetical protein